ncbi:MAG: sigma-70 family RNA polymerase sigma factor [Clostridia bacterium]|nr:sigma-70 family RNA polymerase sigma factor [Clostridia bacterium]
MNDMIAYARQLILMKNILRNRNGENFKVIYSYSIINLLQLTSKNNSINENDVSISIQQAEIQLKKQQEAPRYDFQVFEENIFKVWRISKREARNKLEREIFFSYGLMGLLISVTIKTDIIKGIESEISKTKSEWEEYKNRLRQSKNVEYKQKIEKNNKQEKDEDEENRKEYLRYLHQYDEESKYQKGIYYQSYLSVGNLPEPLDADEKQAYIYGWYKATGKDEIDPRLRDLIWMRNLRLVSTLSIKYSNITYAEDLYSIGVEALEKCIERFKPSRGIDFGKFASTVIIREFLMHNRDLKKYSSRIVHIDDVISRDKNGNEQTYMDVLVYDDSVENISIHAWELDQLRLILKDLSERDTLIVQLRYLDDPHLTQKEVSDKLQITPSYISRLEKKIINKLKNLIDEAV